MTAKTATAMKKEPKRKSDPYYLRAVGKAIEVYQILEQTPQMFTLNQLAQKVSLTKSSAFRILHTLEIAGYLRRTEDGRYEVAGDGRSRMPAVPINKISAAAVEPLRDLVHQFGETVGMAMLFENHIEVVSVVESPQIIRMGNVPGRILPPHASALGKCISAFQPEERREGLLRSYGLAPITSKTITDRAELQREFERIQKEGFARDDEESTLDGYCFAAPISSPAGDVVAGISISIPKMRASLYDMDRVIAEVVRAADKVTAAIR